MPNPNLRSQIFKTFPISPVLLDMQSMFTLYCYFSRPKKCQHMERCQHMGRLSRSFYLRKVRFYINLANLPFISGLFNVKSDLSCRSTRIKCIIFLFVLFVRRKYPNISICLLCCFFRRLKNCQHTGSSTFLFALKILIPK